MKKKIIQILCHTLENDKDLDYYVRGNWCARTARSILSATSDYNCEAWYAVRNYNKVETFIENGLTFRLFPAKTLHPLLESFYGIISSPLLIDAIKREDSNNCVIQFQGERGSLLHEVISKYPNYHITIQYHGYGQPSQFNWLETLFITPQERKHFPSVSHFFVHIKHRIQYLEKTLKISKSRISYQNVGVDFTRFKPRDKQQSRKKLNLPSNAFIMLYVGTMVKTKGVDMIMRSYQKLKQKYNNLYLLLVGARPFDPLYDGAIKVADKVLGVTDNQSLPLYYNAADIYCFYGNEKTIKYAGIGTAPTEALASNLNTISTNLIHLPEKIVSKVGYIPNNEQDFIQKTEYLIKHPTYKFNARHLVAPFTSLSYMTKNLLKIYESIFSAKHRCS